MARSRADAKKIFYPRHMLPDCHRHSEPTVTHQTPHNNSVTRRQMKLYLVTDDTHRPADELAGIIHQAILGGATAVQFREKTREQADLLQAFDAVKRVCQAHQVPLFLNADLLDALPDPRQFQGIHYSSRTLGRRPHFPAHMAGYSAHTLPEARQAYAAGAHFCTISPIYSTPSKAGILSPVGTQAITDLRAACPGHILVALGGINTANAPHCVAAGADGVAVIREVINAANPRHAAQILRAATEKHTTP